MLTSESRPDRLSGHLGAAKVQESIQIQENRPHRTYFILFYLFIYHGKLLHEETIIREGVGWLYRHWWWMLVDLLRIGGYGTTP